MNKILILTALLVPIVAVVIVSIPKKNVRKSATLIKLKNFPVTTFEKKQEIPFSNLSTKNHSINLQFDFNSFRSDLIIKKDTYAFPDNQLVTGTLEFDKNAILVVSREIYDGNLHFYHVRLHTKEIEQLYIPEAISYSIFRKSFVANGYVYLILYNVLDNRNYLYRYKNEEGNLIYDTDFVHQLFFGGRYEISDNILTAKAGDTQLICSDGTCYRIGKKVQLIELDKNLRILEVVGTEKTAYGLFQKAEYNALEQKDNDIFVIINILTKEKKPILSVEYPPYKLRLEDGKPTYSIATDEKGLKKMFDIDMKNLDSSGLLNFAMNNYEGRVAWSQVYYLNAYIDILKNWENKEYSFSFFSKMLPSIKKRLDMEMFMLDKLLSSEYGLKCKRYTVNRQEAVHAVQTGRVLRLFKRYRSQISNPIKLDSYENLLTTTTNLTNHIEVLEKANNTDGLYNGQYYLKWPIGSDFPFDGVGIPYNHMDDWVSGIIYGMDTSYFKSKSALISRDIVNILINNERLDTNQPQDFKWHYWWGKAKQGWTKQENVSINTPQYAGDKGIAHISYRTIDAMAIMNVSRIYPEIIDTKLMSYIKSAIEQDGIYVFALEDWDNTGIIIRPELQLKYIRMDSAWNMQNAVWMYNFMFDRLKSAD